MAEDAKTDAERADRERSDFLKHIDADGRVLDFHGTRHTYIRAIVAGGASVKTCQELARHSHSDADHRTVLPTPGYTT